VLHKPVLKKSYFFIAASCYHLRLYISDGECVTFAEFFYTIVMPDNELFRELLNKYVSGSLTEQENKMLMQMLEQGENDPGLDGILRESLDQTWDERFWTDEFRKDFTARLFAKGGIPLPADEHIRPVRPTHRIHFLKTGWFRYVAAVIVLFGTGALIRTIYKKNDQASVQRDKQVQVDVSPGREGAILTLADGTQVALDSLGNGTVATQNGTRVKLEDGQLAYDAAGNSSSVVSYNTMTTPKGRQFQLVLPDGSKVWLNAATSIKYPTVFAENKRLVEIEGEAYFEIADNEKPFMVKVNDAMVTEVLGTSFNINSYENEKAVKTTLIEGSIRVNAYGHLQMLKPGQQVQVYPDQTLKMADNIDINQVTAWKNGYFDFNNADLQVMMRQLERWYDITVVYEGKMPTIVFKGQMDRNVQLSDVIRFLTASGIKTSQEGRTLIIR
jgi:ferric-dicitrate binding protein FerR (iron transport regulator)